MLHRVRLAAQVPTCQPVAGLCCILQCRQLHLACPTSIPAWLLRKSASIVRVVASNDCLLCRHILLFSSSNSPGGRAVLGSSLGKARIYTGAAVETNHDLSMHILDDLSAEKSQVLQRCCAIVSAGPQGYHSHTGNCMPRAASSRRHTYEVN